MKKHKTKKFAKFAALPLALVTAASIGAAMPVASAETAIYANYNYYTWDYDSAAEMLAEAKNLNTEICAEGFTLLKNDGLLPMSPKPGNTKIKASIFGNHSAKIVGFGFGSSMTLTGLGDSLYTCFENEGFELNPELKAFYNDDSKSGAKIDASQAVDQYYMGVPSFETPINKYPAGIENSFAEYNDVAVVVLSRWAGEGSDLSNTSLKQGFTERNDENKQTGARHWDDHYLQLDANEVAMLQMVMNHFDNIMLVMNGSSYIELGFLKDPTHYLYTDNDYTADAEAATAKMNKFKGLINVSYPGDSGIKALPRIMTGKVNPSGHLVDTWVKELKEDPTFKNNGTSGQTYSELRNGEYYVHYDEDIYMGYRYYETRYLTEGDNGDAWYDYSVMYPYGYGLSYTTFDWEVLDAPVNAVLDKDGSVSVKVKVTNTGDVAGKDVVQLYYNPPYYTGGIAKAHVVMGGFQKTELLEPGEEEIVTVSMKVYDMRSYDWSDANNNGIKGFELDHGKYNVIVAHDAHDAAKLPEGRTIEYTLNEDVYYATDAETGVLVTNLFDYMSGTGKTNDPTEFKGIRQYFSRDDFEGTFPTHSSEKRDGLRQGKQQFLQTEKFDSTQPWHETEMPKQATNPGTSNTNTIKLWHMRGRDADDPLWDELLDQLTIEEMAAQIGNGFRGPRPIASIDKPDVWDTDGPIGRRESQDIQWCANTILAQTYNTELAYEEGVMFGNVVFTCSQSKRGGTYGVGLDIHRTPFAGRYFEYYSEDGWLCGVFGAEVVKGSNSKGCYQIIKHLLLNDMETQRNTIQTWASEQALREIYGKGFEMAIKAGALGIMTGVNSVGDIPNAMNYNLLTKLVREEWGFNGMLITDMYCEDTNICIRAGLDTMMSYPNPKNPHTESEYLTPTHVQAMRNACKHIFYAMANSNGINGMGGTNLLDKINYIGSDNLYSVVNVQNELTVGTAIVSSNENARLTYALAEGSTLPAGLSLEEDGTITGTPTESGTYNFSVVASEDTSAVFPYKDVKKNFRLTVYEPSAIPDKVIYEDVDLGTVPYGYEFSKSIASAAAFGTDGKLSTDIVYKLTDGSELPKGLTLKDGVIEGKLEAAPGTYFFTVEAQCPGKQSAYLDFIVNVKAFKIDYAYKPITAELGVGKFSTFSVADATSEDGISITYAVKDGSKLPEGLRLESTGEITGAPTRAYNGYEFTVLAMGKNAEPQEMTYKVDVAGVVFDDYTFDGLLIDKNYSFKLSAKANNGVKSKIYYELKEGSELPDGMHLLADGTLFGTCSDWGKQSFTVLAKSEGNATVESTVTLDFYALFDPSIEDEPTIPTVKPQKSGGNGWVLPTVLPICIVLVLGGGVLAYFLVKRNKGKTQEK